MDKVRVHQFQRGVGMCVYSKYGGGIGCVGVLGSIKDAAATSLSNCFISLRVFFFLSPPSCSHVSSAGRGLSHCSHGSRWVGRNTVDGRVRTRVWDVG